MNARVDLSKRPEAQTLSDLASGPVAPTGLSASMNADAVRVLEDATAALDCVSSQIEALRVALLQLVPLREHTGALPEDTRRALAAARVLLDQSLQLQSAHLVDWVGDKLDDLSKILKGCAA
jgi:hypothetical protein